MRDERLCLVDIVAAVDAAGTTQTLRYANIGYTTEPDDTPDNTHYQERIGSVGRVRREMFSGSRSSGRSTIGYGDVVLVNRDGGLDDLRLYSFGNRAVTVRTGFVADAFDDLTVALVATAGQVDLAAARITLRLKDRSAELDLPLQQTLFAGTNVLPAGVEGVDDLKGQPKPRCYGRVFNVSPPCVNTSRLIYQVNDGPITTLDAVYDGGVALVAGTARASQAALEAGVPAAGQYDYWLAGGMFKLGSSPVYQITADASEESGANSTCAQILKRIAIDAGIAGGDIDAGDVTALDTASTAVCGVWLDGQPRAVEVMDMVAPGAGAFYGFDREGVLRMGQFAEPAGSPVVEISQTNTQQLERVANADSLPTWRVVVEHSRNHTVQTSGLAGAVTSARRAALAREFKSATSDDASVQDQWLDAQTLTRTTPLTTDAAAQAEADRLQALYGEQAEVYEATGVVLDADTIAALELNAVVTLTWDRFGLDAGRLMRVLALDVDYVKNKADLTLWGRPA